MHIFRTKRRNFIRDLMLVFFLLCAAVLGSVAFIASRAREDIAQKTIDNATVSAVRQFETMVNSITQSLELAGDWIASGKLSLSRAKELNDLLFLLLKRDRLLSGIAMADTAGNSYSLTVNGDGEGDRQMISEETQPLTLDLRSQPWFYPALAGQGVFWTRPYLFVDRKVVGVTASIAKKVDGGQSQVVVAFDVPLDDLFNEIQRMAPSENGRVFVFRNDAQLYVPSDQDDSADFFPLGEVDDPLIRKMVASWEKRHRPPGKAFFINHDKQTWWCGFQAMENANRNVWVGVMVPESDIIGGVSRRRTGLWGIGSVILLMTGLVAFFMISRYGRSFDLAEDLYDGRHPEESIRQLIAKGEGSSIEFKSTMRMNLHTQKPGKEIEIAWLKAVVAFMNTDGGTLLLGVSDDGMIKGLDADGFASDDKCQLHFKNVINQSIGVEAHKYLNFNLVKVDGKQIGVVSCIRSAEPVYLKTGKAEEFYIRSGPSSDALPVSKIVTYLQNRR
ncbi:MAG: RNA-binding domain-containing protein [Pseudomonadota bacterium]